MKIKPTLAFAPALPRLSTFCSTFVLASLGVFGLEPVALAQTTLPAGAAPLPVLRGIVSGRVVVNAPVKGAPTQLMTIDQASQTAILDWKSFNIASDAEVRFNQPGSTATALNRIYGTDPSVILGKLTANGQVLLINQNGILFGAGAQINVQSLVASTLNMSNAQFLKGAGALTTGGLTTPAFEGGYDDQGNTMPARPDGSISAGIVLGAGGTAGSAGAPTLAAKAGGSIMLFAPRINNQDALITAPDGQVMLAAGAKVYLVLPSDDDTVLRGMRVEVEAVDGAPINLTSLVRNAGSLTADRGNVTLAGLAINQEGRISANTAVQANGSVYLQARTRATETAPSLAGSVKLAAGSVTQVLPDATDKSTLPESESYVARRGLIQVEGATIENQGMLAAAGGRITLSANDASNPTAARIYLGDGSSTSVAGNVADVDFKSNLLTFKITSNELKDSPDQKNGVLRGSTVTVDLRKANPTLDLSGYINAQARTVAEKAAVGGELSMSSSGSVIQRSGATLDASGGGYRYSGGTSPTSRLLGDDGKLYDIGTAPKDRTYKSVADTFTKVDAKWGQSTTYTGLLYGLGQQETGYFEGKAGGSISVSAASGLVLDGLLKGGVTVGPNQLNKAPRGASLTIGGLNREGTDFADGQHIGNVTFTQSAGAVLDSGFDVNSALTGVQRDQVQLSAEQLFGSAAAPGTTNYSRAAFGSVEINSNGHITVPEGVSVDGAPGSSLVLRAPKIDIAGAVTMPAGQITLQPQFTATPVDAGAGFGTTVHSGASLSTAGLWINTASADGSYVGAVLPSARLNADGTTSSMLNGGGIAILAPVDSTTVLERGSTLDVGGGGAIDRNRRVTNGNGGALSIANALSANLSSDWLQADLQGFALGNGGSLAISTQRVVIDPATANGTLPANTTRLLPELFSEHGFSNIQISASEGLSVAADAHLLVQQKNLVIDPVAAASLAGGGDLKASARVELLPDHLRQAAGLTLSSTGSASTLATLSLDKDASIVTDPRGRVSLRASNGMQLDGRISAPGGNVSARLTAPANLETPDLKVGETAAISVAGSFVPQPDNNGLLQGSVIGAGSITFEAVNSGVDLAAGSRLNLNGVSQRVDYVDPTKSAGVSQRQVDGNAGTLVVKSQGQVNLGSTITANRASGQSAGGSFALELTAPSGRGVKPDERRIVVTQAAPTTAPAVSVGHVDAAIAIDPLVQAGFDKLRLLSEDSIQFDGNVNLAFQRGIRLDAPLLDVRDSGLVKLNSANVAIGQSLGPRSLQGETYELSPLAASLPVDTRAGSGVFAVQADTIDLFGSTTINGITEARLFAEGDIRLTGRSVRLVAGQTAGAQVGGLTTEGNVLFSAAQLYPSTRTEFNISVAKVDSAAAAETGGNSAIPVSGGSITVASNGKAASDVYSVGGTLTLSADTIVQGGTVKVPQGELDLRAVSHLELTPGSVTTVSAGGLTVPLGTTDSGIIWNYVDGAGSLSTLTAPGGVAKRVELSGQRIDVRPGATVDIAGGGEVQAIEFVPGNGGSTDTLIKPNTYAIIPKSKLTSMPVDTDVASRQDIGFGLQTAALDTSIYNGLVIGAGSIVPAGEYVLLPGRYALLPDAYLVQLQTGSAYTNLQPGQSTQLVNGQTVVAGYRTVRGTDVRESNTVGVLIRQGGDARRESDYTLTGSSYFADAAVRDRTTPPRLPIDAGKVAILNVAELTLAGDFKTEAGSKSSATGVTVGRGAEVDLSAERLALVDHVGRTDIDAAYLQVSAKELSSLGGSVLVGGRRTENADGSTQITTGASQLLVANDSASELKVPELLLAATGDIDIRSGSVLAGTGGAANANAVKLRSEAGGALLRLSSGGQATVDRGASPDSAVGVLRVAAGATLRADGSMLLDATQSTQSQGNLKVGSGTGGALSLASSQVSLGQTDGIAGLDGGLVLSNAALAGLNGLDALVIKGYQGIDLFGAAVVGNATLSSLTLDSGALRGNVVEGAVASTIKAKEVHLLNSSGLAAATAPVRGGALGIAAERLVIEGGQKTISGFSAVTASGSSEIMGEGAGVLQVGSDLTLQSPRVGVAAGAVQTWRALEGGGETAVQQALKLERPAGDIAIAADSTAAGGRLRLEGRSVEVATTVQARSGTIAIAAKGNDSGDGVTLGATAVLDARGIAKDYNGNVVVAGAGQVELSSAAGQMTLAAGSKVDVRGVSGGNAGTVSLEAPRLNLSGSLDGSAQAGGTSARFVLDAGALTDFSALNSSLNQGSFNESRDIRVRTGDLRVKSTDVVTARELTLAADAGRIDIEGTLNARSDKGSAKVDVWAANGLALTGAQVLADGSATDNSAAAALSNGGQVRLSAGGGPLAFDAASTIDVRPGAKGRTGSVTFAVARDDSNSMAPVQLSGTVLGARAGNGSQAVVALEAKRVYAVDTNITAGDIATFAADHAAFIGSVDPTASLSALKGDFTASVRGATELRAAGDLTLDQAWNLTTSEWLAKGDVSSLSKGQSGTLTLRAGGNLTVSEALGAPNDNLLAGDTWNIRLVGGADLTAANPLATQRSLTDLALVDLAAPAKGSVTISTDAGKVRTGTGWIEIAAAGDFRMDALKSVVYTAGRIGATDTEANGNNRWAQDGGAISIAAGRDATGNSDEWITEWLRRPRATPTTTTFADWWAYRPNFQQGIGTLGGGDIRINAGHDVSGLSAMLPTTGRNSLTDGVAVLDVQGGGDLRVVAGNDLKGGSYLVSRGDGVISVGGNVGSADSRTQLYLQGASSSGVPEKATMRVEAGGSVELQGVNDPTSTFMNTSRAQDKLATTTPANCAACGPSFAGTATSNIPTFFSYSATSRLEVASKSGDVVLGSQLASARTVLPGQAINVTQTNGAGVYPASVQVAAFEGDISGVEGNSIVTFPSAAAQVSLLAQGSLHNLVLTGSDLTPASVPDLSQPIRSTRRLTGAHVLPVSGQPRLITRSVDAGFVFDLQALAGNVEAATLDLPAESRVRAGLDIVGTSFVLQNLLDGDVSEVRSDRGDVRPQNIEVRGPGRLLIQAGRNIDLGPASVARGSPSIDIGGLIATGNTTNASLVNDKSARLTLISGVTGDVDLAKFDASYASIIGINSSSDQILGLFRTLNGDPQRELVLSAASLQALADRDPTYTPYVALAAKYPQLLATYQATLRSGALPLGTAAEGAQSVALYALLNKESNVGAITNAKSVAELVTGTAGGAGYEAFVALDAKYPRVFADYRQRRSKGALPEGLTPILFSDVLAGVIAEAIPTSAVSSGSISSYLSSIQSYAGSDIDLWAPNGNIVVGLTTPRADKTIGVVTNAGGAIRSVLSGDFSINQGKVLTAQGGDILIYSSAAGIDAGRGAKTSLSTPPPKRTPILVTPEDGGEPIIVGYQYTLPASASGSGIQTLSSDPDGLGPRVAAPAGSIYLFAPAGTIDAGEAGIRSGGNIVINAQTVLNSSNIAASGSSAGVPVATTGSLASSLATGGVANTASKAGDDAAASATSAARAAAAAEGLQKPTILTVEVLGFGDKNCKEKDKDCFAK